MVLNLNLKKSNFYHDSPLMRKMHNASSSGIDVVSRSKCTPFIHTVEWTQLNQEAMQKSNIIIKFFSLVHV